MMRNTVLRRAPLMLACAMALQLPGSADAAAYLFTLSGPNTASFMLDSSPAPAGSGATYFAVQNVTGTYNGSPLTFGGLTFYTAGAASGGLLASSGGTTFLDLEGPQLFTGTTASPTFRLGIFNLDDGARGSYILSIAAPSVPEPGTWAMMLIGFGAMALAFRTRRLRYRVASQGHSD
jgi:hypothetical protein